jgi:hypothetical protein
MAVTYTPKIQWPDNGRRLQAKDYKIQVPTGLSDVHIWEPNFVDVAAMAKTNERARRRDAPEEYAKVQDRIDTLRVKQINRSPRREEPP